MDEDEFDRRLKSSAPAAAPRTPALLHALDDLIAESRSTRRRRNRAVVAGMSLSLMLLGGTSAAFAAEPLLAWLGFEPDHVIQHVNSDGVDCAAGMIIRPEGVELDDPSFLAAQEIFRGIDFAKLEIPEHIRNDERYSDAARTEKSKAIDEWNAAHPDAPMEPAGWDPQAGMLQAAAFELVTEEVRARGLDETHFSIEAGGECGEVEQ
ncbi:hypothetical protein ET445_00795 [Agromyces protaetiae]|uniref:Uncharacterized protein n=1 Tax=Agromyces protaetiae TaxID=2509455 RepID=A0A4P6F931_9MICO|nr:hypothetical protein [Agromyces protaetiae]QAY72085.1 hypothetical protein ET445_00795 [Agromyces protaetiae]